MSARLFLNPGRLSRCVFLLVIGFASVSHVYGEDSIRIMTYNLLKYPGSTSAERNPHFKRIIQAIDPDIIVVEELASEAAMNQFLTEALDRSFSTGTYIDGPDTDCGIFYKPLLFSFVSNTAIPTELRNINEFTLVYLQSGDTIRLFGAHLKASSGSANEQQRYREALALRSRTASLQPNSDYLVLGDFNLYSSAEAAFGALLDTAASGYFIDPIDVPGKWSADEAFAEYHTQATRLEQFGGGAYGGLDDRFDFILVSPSLMRQGGFDYKPGSYTAFGNDGAHFNTSVNAEPPNACVPQEIADALYLASDHLPVYLTLTYRKPSAVDQAVACRSFTLEQNYPNPFNTETTISFSVSSSQPVRLTVTNSLGTEMAVLLSERVEAGRHSTVLTVPGAQNGLYWCTLSTSEGIQTIPMMAIH